MRNFSYPHRWSAAGWRATLTLSLALALHLLCLGAAAEYIPPQNVSVKTAHYQPQSTNFARGTYKYEVSWQGLPVGAAEIEVGDSGNDTLKVQARAQTSGVVAVFYKLRHRSESSLNARSLRPEKFYTWQKENDREKSREIFFDNGNIRSTGLKNGEPSDTVEFHSDNLTLDPISAAFVARTIPLKQGEKLDFDVFNGKHRYLISFKVMGRESVAVGGGKKRDAFRVVPTVKKLTDSNGEKRLDSATLWVSADDSRDVLKLESKVFVGRVSARLISFTPKRALHARLTADAAPSRN